MSILIPARNEAANIERAVRAACMQTTDVEVIVLDDDSTDATPALLGRLAARERRLTVVRGAALPPGWTGKSWACWQMARRARRDWLMFVDADVRLAPDAVSRAVAAARAQGEALVVPMIHLVLLAWLPMALIRAAYLACGGHRAHPATLHDGIMLGRRLKATGHVVALVDATDLASCRTYAGPVGTWRGFTRNAYEAFGSPGALLVMASLNLVAFVVPFAGLAVAVVQGRGAPAMVFGLAVAAMIAIQLHSFLNHCTGRRIAWRARVYPPVRAVAADERTA